MSAIIAWTPFEQLVYISRIFLILLSAAFLGSLIAITIKLKFNKLGNTAKLLLVLLGIYALNILVFYLGYVVTRPEVSIGSLRNIGDTVVLLLGLIMIRTAARETDQRAKEPIKLEE
jgi:Na+/H+-dicarboxylate symporter